MPVAPLVDAPVLRPHHDVRNTYRDALIAARADVLLTRL